MSRVPLGNVTAWQVESSTSAGTFYTVLQDGSGRWSCDCPSFRHRETECKHIRLKAAELVMERERLRDVLNVFARYDPDDVRERLAALDEVLGSS